MREMKQPGNEMETVSVLVPVYNVDQYLAECLDSVLAQTYRHQRRLNRSQLPNGGLSVASNTGLTLFSPEPEIVT